MNLADLAPIAYPWLEAFHVIAVIASMAGIFLPPALFVYHAGSSIGSRSLRSHENNISPLDTPTAWRLRSDSARMLLDSHLRGRTHAQCPRRPDRQIEDEAARERSAIVDKATDRPAGLDDGHEHNRTEPAGAMGAAYL